MALTVTSRGFVSHTYTTSSSIPAFTPTAGNILVVQFMSDGAGDLTTIANHQDGTGWSKLTASVFNTQSHQLWICKVESSPSSNDIDLTFPYSRGTVTCVEIGGDFTGLTAAQAFVQTAANTGYDVTTLAPTLASFADATNNLTFYTIANHNTNPNPSFAPEAGHTEAIEPAATHHSVSVNYFVGEDTSPTVTITNGEFRSHSVIGAEVKEAAASSSALLLLST